MEGQSDVKSVFVTVGTTSFDRLIKSITQPSYLEILRLKGYQKLTLQIGRGEYVPDNVIFPGIEIEHFRYKDSIAECFNSCDLVISHAGAGSCTEALSAKKALLVVINEELMGNHQLELAHQLAKDGHLLFCNCSQLEETTRTFCADNLLPFEPGKPEKFASFLDKIMGVA